MIMDFHRRRLGHTEYIYMKSPCWRISKMLWLQRLWHISPKSYLDFIASLMSLFEEWAFSSERFWGIKTHVKIACATLLFACFVIMTKSKLSLINSIQPLFFTPNDEIICCLQLISHQNAKMLQILCDHIDQCVCFGVFESNWLFGYD